MNWYYALNNQRVGPVAPADFEHLVQQGIINSTTLVWREGMADWKTYGEVSGGGAAVASPTVTAGGVRCVECGGWFAADQVIKLPPGFVCGACKPVVMQKLGEGVLSSSVEQIRNEHLKHEASVKSVGVLYFLGGCVLMLAGLGGAIGGRGASGILGGVIFLALGDGQLTTAVGLRRLKSWARIPTGIFSGLGLLAFPVGTLINAYILYLIFSRKGAMVFSEEYKRVMAETPHIKYRTSIVVWIFLGLVVLLVLIGLISWGVARNGRTY